MQERYLALHQYDELTIRGSVMCDFGNVKLGSPIINVRIVLHLQVISAYHHHHTL